MLIDHIAYSVTFPSKDPGEITVRTRAFYLGYKEVVQDSDEINWNWLYLGFSTLPLLSYNLYYVK